MEIGARPRAGAGLAQSRESQPSLPGAAARGRWGAVSPDSLGGRAAGLLRWTAPSNPLGRWVPSGVRML